MTYESVEVAHFEFDLLLKVFQSLAVRQPNVVVFAVLHAIDGAAPRTYAVAPLVTVIPTPPVPSVDVATCPIAPVPFPYRTAPEVRVACPVPPLPTGSVPVTCDVSETCPPRVESERQLEEIE